MLLLGYVESVEVSKDELQNYFWNNYKANYTATIRPIDTVDFIVEVEFDYDTVRIEDNRVKFTTLNKFRFDKVYKDIYCDTYYLTNNRSNTVCKIDKVK